MPLWSGDGRRMTASMGDLQLEALQRSDGSEWRMYAHGPYSDAFLADGSEATLTDAIEAAEDAAVAFAQAILEARE